jgi:hypothetical protein
VEHATRIPTGTEPPLVDLLAVPEARLGILWAQTGDCRVVCRSPTADRFLSKKKSSAPAPSNGFPMTSWLGLQSTYEVCPGRKDLCCFSQGPIFLLHHVSFFLRTSEILLRPRPARSWAGQPSKTDGIPARGSRNCFTVDPDTESSIYQVYCTESSRCDLGSPTVAMIYFA